MGFWMPELSVIYRPFSLPGAEVFGCVFPGLKSGFRA